MAPVLFRSYKPSHAENRMRGEGDVLAARADYIRRKSGNLRVLLRDRFEWMNEYISCAAIGVDIGCGAGLSREFIRCKRLLLTDFTDHKYLDVGGVDALHLPFADRAFDFVIATNVIHHLPTPMVFFREARRVLRAGGVLLIQEVQASLLMRLVLRAMRHEGYTFDINVFDDSSICTDPDDLWAGNNAIPRLLFDNHKTFLESQAGWRILRDEACECVTFLNSGGVTAKTAYLPLPALVLAGVAALDRVLAKSAPNLIALGRRVVLERCG